MIKKIVIPAIIGIGLIGGSFYYGYMAFHEHKDYADAEEANEEVQDIAHGDEFPKIEVEDDDRPHVDEDLLPDHTIVEDANDADYTIELPDDVKDPDDPNLDWYMSMQIHVAELQTINPDVMCWIYVPNTYINYPVLQEKWDDEHGNTRSDYIYEDMYNNYSVEGSLFVKAVSPSVDASKNAHMTVYGHNMKNGSMFATLVRYKNETFFKDNPYVYVFYPDRTERWAVWATGHITTSDNSPAPVYTTFYELGSQEYKNCIDYINNNRYYDTYVKNVDENTRTLTLSTCDWINGNHSGRMILTAVKDKTLIWEGER